jgi:ribosomal protein S18 acetylase RimI-like enzyme
MLIGSGAIGAAVTLPFPTDVFVATVVLLFLALSWATPTSHVVQQTIPVTIRAAQSTDAPVLAPMAVALAGMHGIPLVAEAVETAIAALLGEQSAQLKMLVAETAEPRVVGYATYLDLQDLPYRTPYRRVTELFVCSDCRSAGIGKALLVRMREHCKLAGLDLISIEMMPTNTVARRFYGHLGFREVERVSYVEMISIPNSTAVNAGQLRPTSAPQAEPTMNPT